MAKRPAELVSLSETINPANLSSTPTDVNDESSNHHLPKRICTDLRNGSFLGRPEVFRIGPSIFLRTKLHFDTPTYEYACNNVIENDIAQALPINAWGLPEQLVKYYYDKGIENLFKWQVQALWQPGVFDYGRNLVYSAPTSAGKSMVADMLMFKTFYERKKKVIIILPFVSISHEKVNALKTVLQYTGITIESFAGNVCPPGGFARVDAAVCTIEKANNLINRLIEEGKLSDVGLVIVDELHMLADSSRGYLLELLLSKLIFATKLDQKSVGAKIQIVGMSATIPNLSTIASWLNAALFVTDFRPVPLTQLVAQGDDVYEVVGEPNENSSDWLKPVEPALDLASLEINSSPDDAPLVYYAMDTLSKGLSTLVFCPTKLGTERTARLIAENIFEFGAKLKGPKMTDRQIALGTACRSNLCMKKINKLYTALFGMPMGFDHSLAKVVRFGCANHHAGMSLQERSLIEQAFRDGTIKVLCATTTLSAGVNLPARRVLINSPYDYSGAFLNVATYRQMIGRAGRAGIDTMGEAVLFCKEKDYNKALKNVVGAKLPPVKSCLVKEERALLYSSQASSQSSFVSASQVTQMSLSQVASAVRKEMTQNSSNCLKRAILEVVSNGTANSQTEVEDYIKSTFCSVSSQMSSEKKEEWVFTPNISPGSGPLTSNSQMEIRKAIEEAAYDLKEDGLILDAEDKENESCGKQLVVSTLGKAIVASGIGPEEGQFIQRELDRARLNIKLENDLHIVYLLTPPYIAKHLDLDWDLYWRIYGRLSEAQRRVGELVGVGEGYLILRMNNSMPVKRSSVESEKLLVHQRFYASLALFDLVQEVPLKNVVERFKINKGHVQSLQQQAATFAGMLVTFCERMGADWEEIGFTFRSFQPRLAFGVHADLVDLMRLSYLTSVVARELFIGGIKTMADLVAAQLNDVEQLLFVISKSEAVKNAKTTRSYLGSQTTSSPKTPPKTPDEGFSSGSQTIGMIYVPRLNKFISVADLSVMIINEARLQIEAESGHKFKDDHFENEKTATAEVEVNVEDITNNEPKDNVEGTILQGDDKK